MAVDLATGIRLGIATELASAGAYLRAETWIVGEPGKLLSGEELDLLARVYVLQDRYAEAESCWQKAAAANPSEPKYRQALKILKEHQGRLIQRSRLLIALFAFMVFMGAVAVAVLLVFGKTA